ESGPELVDRGDGTRLRIVGEIVAGEKLTIKRSGDVGVAAEITASDGTVKRLPDSSILAGRIGAQARVPFAGEWPLSRPGGPDQRPSLQLNDPRAPSIVLVRALKQLNAPEQITIQVVPDQIASLFQVRVRFTGPGGPIVESYPGVTIGFGDTPLSLQVKILERPSQLVHAYEISKADSLRLPRGSLHLTYMNCHEARFNRVMFAATLASEVIPEGAVARFAGGRCRESAVFDISRFSDLRPEGEQSLFGSPVP